MLAAQQMSVIVVLLGACVGAAAGLLGRLWAQRLLGHDEPVAAPWGPCVAGVCAGVCATAAHGLSPLTLELCLLVPALVALSLTDRARMVIPDPCVVVLACVHLVCLVVPAPLGQGAPWDAVVRAIGCGAASLVALVVLTLAMDRLLGADSLGGGDVKLLAVVGLCVGWRGLMLVMPAACCLGLASALARPVAERSAPFAFGPALAVAFWVVLLAWPALDPMTLALIA